MRLLYVEDEISMARTIEILLRQEGYDFDTAHCGQDAIDLAKTNRYDLILLDIMLPDFDGYEVIDRLHRSGIDTPFLVQTGLIDRGDPAEAASLGVTEYLIKPFNKSELIDGIESAVARAAKKRMTDNPKHSGAQATGRGDDRREHRRFVTLKSARVLRPSVFDCVILNMSYGGAAIKLPTESQGLPPEFDIEISGMTVPKCRLCWRVGDKAGIKFSWTDAQRDDADKLSDELKSGRSTR